MANYMEDARQLYNELVRGASGAGAAGGATGGATGGAGSFVSGQNAKVEVGSTITPRHNNNFPMPPPFMPMARTQPTLNEMVAYRMRWDTPVPFKHLNAVRDNDKVFVFIIHDGRAITLEEGYDLFPSDTLITQLRLLL